MTMKNESGRSMVEMLGVLAIIGVLSIGGIAGYTMAMNRYRANEAVDGASKIAIIAMTANAGVGQAQTWTTDMHTPLPPCVDEIKADADGKVGIDVSENCDGVADIIGTLAGTKKLSTCSGDYAGDVCIDFSSAS